MKDAVIVSMVTVLALATSVAQARAQGRSGSGGNVVVRTRCAACPDSGRRVEIRAERSRLERRLRELERRLQDEETGGQERERLAEEIANLTLALTEMSSRIAVEIVPRMTTELAPIVIEEMRRGFTAARRALHDEGLFHRFAPKGWLGINVDGHPEQILVRDGELFLRFADFPSVVSIDPNSPADRAGVRRGDRVVAYNGQDVRRTLAMSQILTPNKPVTVRVRRDGGTRDLRMVTVEVPGYVRERRSAQIAPMPPEIHMLPMPASPARAPATPGSQVVVSGTPRPPRVFSNSSPDGQFFTFETGDFKRSPAIVGAQIQELSEELGEVIGVKRGLLVLRSFAGTPAYEAGLRAGDVIIRVEGRDVATIGTFFASVAAEKAKSDGESVTLDVVRKGAKRKVTLRWE